METVNETSLLRDLAVFADLGTGPPQMMPSYNHRSIVRMFRGGEGLELEFHGPGYGKVIERSLDGGDGRTHASYKALLASEKIRQFAPVGRFPEVTIERRARRAGSPSSRLGYVDHRRGEYRSGGARQLSGQSRRRPGARRGRANRRPRGNRENPIHRESGVIARTGLSDAPTSPLYCMWRVEAESLPSSRTCSLSVCSECACL